MSDTMKSWVERQLRNFESVVLNRKYAKDDELVAISPDEKGAVGNGVTVDDEAFLNGNYIYQLSGGKTYRISKEKLLSIHNNGVTGKGAIRVIRNNSWESRPYGGNTLILPTYGKSIYEMSTRAPQNRFEECVERFTDANTYEVVSMGRYFKEQNIKPPVDDVGAYHNIGAIYYDYDKVDQLPSSFTICIGRSVIFENKSGSNEWVKAIDEKNISIRSIKNYRLPWHTEEGQDRWFNHSAEIVDNHLEIVIDKEELTSWLGTQTTGTEGVIHFWGSRYYFDKGEYNDLINYWELWVKEPEASGCLHFASGVDVFSTTESEKSFYMQSIVMATMPVTNTPQAFWGCTMNIDGARKVRFEDLTTQLYQKDITHVVSGAGRNFNILGVDVFEPITANRFSIAHDSDDIFTLSVGEGENKWSMLNMTPYLLSTPDIKTGDTFRINIEVLEGGGNYIGNLYYANGKSCEIYTNVNTKVKDNIYSSQVFTALVDCDRIIIGTNATTLPETTKFRMWITKGEEFKPYQRYGESVDARVLNDNIIDKYLDDKVKALESTVDALIAEVTALKSNNESLL